jgi:hypothetical protein
MAWRDDGRGVNGGLGCEGGMGLVEALRGMVKKRTRVIKLVFLASE